MGNEPKLADQTIPEATDAPNDTPNGISAPARRRLLRASLKATPVVIAALASRPSFACHCVMPSAWGSLNTAFDREVDINGQTTFTASLARYNNGNEQVGFSPYGYSAFRSGSGIWIALADLYKASAANNLSPNISQYQFDNDEAKVAFAKGNKVYVEDKKIYKNRGDSNNRTPLPLLSLGSLLQGLGLTGATSISKPGRVVRTYNFEASILIAWANLKLGKLPDACIDASVLEAMATGSYTPMGVAEPWGKAEIVSYLHHNWMARQGY